MLLKTALLHSLGRRGRGTLVVIVVTLVLASADTQSMAQSGITEQIKRLWKERESRFRTIKLEYVETRSMSKGFVSRSTSPKSNPDELIIPSQEVTHKTRCEFGLADDKMRYYRDGPSWSWHHHTFEPRQYVSASDGERSVSYWLPTTERGDAIIHRGKFNTDLQNLYLTPLFLMFRPLTLAGIELDEYLPSGQPGVVENRKCLVLVNEAKSHVDNLWLDPTRGFVPLRFTSLHKNGWRLQYEFYYKEEPGFEWTIISWRGIQTFSKTTEQETCDVRVTNSLFNEVVPLSEFQPTFAPGSHVYDMRSRTEFVVPSPENQIPVLIYGVSGLLIVFLIARVILKSKARRALI